ncbi:nucleotide exchange factor GrpE [Phycisphaerales bacterium AB-hyl4]|uniref:Protein GrpE n=1 Tax=Natronomicrosphaera hydrolytica TaxID=3242702 RepID=A0ABV4U3I8_9BACT
MMNRKKKDNDKQPDAAQPSPGDTSPEEAAESEDSQTPDAELVENELKEAISSIERERDELEDRLKRIAADYQNFVRRSEQNIASAREQQLFDFARGLVTVLDHFDRALEVDPEKTSAKDLMAGMTMVRDELMRALNRFGVERMDVSKGEPFDPNRHEALMRQAVEGVETDHVTAQYQPGYTLKEKTIRPAQVGVAE